MQRVFLAGRSGQTCPLGCGASALSAKIGSSERVKSLHKRKNIGIATQKRRFFLRSALCATKEKAALAGDQIQKSFLVAGPRGRTSQQSGMMV